jgi:hypothetical protein
MGKKKLEATQHLQRIAALPYNPYFEGEVQKIRKEYAIPADCKKAWDWFFKNHHTGGLRAAWPLFNTETFPLFETSQSINRTEVPLEQDVVRVMERFQLPSYVFYRILQYVLLKDKRCLDPQIFDPNAVFEPVIRRGIPEWKITITGVYPWTKQKKWDEIWFEIQKKWDDFADGTFEKIIQALKSGTSTKRPAIESYHEQMKRYSEWYQLSEIEGLGPVKTLKRWEEKHPEEVDPDDPIDPSTVTHAIQEFREIITPITIKD